MFSHFYCTITFSVLQWFLPWLEPHFYSCHAIWRAAGYVASDINELIVLIRVLGEAILLHCACASVISFTPSAASFPPIIASNGLHGAKPKPKYEFEPEDESLGMFWMAAIYR